MHGISHIIAYSYGPQKLSTTGKPVFVGNISILQKKVIGIMTFYNFDASSSSLFKNHLDY